MSMGWEVGGWFASPVVGRLVDKVCSFISNQYNYEANTKHSLKSLHEYLIQIKAVLHEADQRRIENPDLKKWLLSLKDAIYDAEDVLDMVEYKILEDKIEGKADRTSSISHALFKRARVVVKSINFSGDELDKLNEVLDKLRRIVFDRDHLIELIKLQPTVSLRVSQMMQLRESSSMPIESNLFGRDEERALLMKFILKISDDDGGASSSRNVHVLPVVGIGGVGKTTLVQDVYNNQNVKDHFDLKAWVCVSDNFDVKRLTKEIIESASIRIESASPDFDLLENLDRIQQILQDGLKDKRFLIVLDDIWNENNTKWEQLQRVLNCGKDGSRVIVTTRNEKIAKMMGTKEAIHLEGLADEEFWSFFRQCSFGDENPANYPGLEFVGKQMAEKLKGNPLAAKTVGGMLKQNLNFHHWMEVLKCELWKTNEQEDGIMQALRLSYEYLPSYLKQCFVYCSLFPKDYRYEKTKLVRMWIAHGFILPSGQQLLEKIGEDYFNELLSRSFIHIHEIFENCYVIHDLLHDLAQSLSDGEIYIAENDEAHVSSPKKKVRHISICSNNLSLLCNDKLGNENVRSLVVFNCSVEKTSDILSKLEGLRVLVLHKFTEEELSLKFIQKMMHLRYLELVIYDNRSFNMPELVCKLYHLQVLQVNIRDGRQCVLPNLKEGIDRLIKLRHLKGVTTKGIAWIGSLTLLQDLEFKVNQGEKGFDIGQIRDMSELRRLCLEGLETVKTKEEASQAMLKNKEYLKDLKLFWKEGHHINLQNEEEEVIDVLESLQPHRNLEEFEIKGYGGGGTPSWWNVNWPSNLNTLILSNCSKWEILPPLGHLPFLKVLHLRGMNAVRSIGSEFYASNQVQLSSKTIFPSLEQLTVCDMPELKDWYKIEEEEEGGGGFELFPRLKDFRIGECPKLRGSIFHFPPSNFNQIQLDKSKTAFFFGGTEGVIAVNCDSTSILTEWLPYPDLLTSVEHLEITAPEEMRSCLPTELVEWIQHLTSLHSLCISYCFKLESLPSNLISSLSTLRKLEILNCHNIKSLPEEGLPASIQDLKIDCCHNIKSLSEEGLPASLQQLLLKNCEKLVSLPSNLISLSTLRILKIVNCPKIKSLPEEGLPASIQELHVSRCYDLAKRCMNEYWQKMIAHIPTFFVDGIILVTEDNRKSLKTRFGDYSYAAEEEDKEEE